eukprot:4259156-Prymnesium_polylepis.1
MGQRHKRSRRVAWVCIETTVAPSSVARRRYDIGPLRLWEVHCGAGTWEVPLSLLTPTGLPMRDTCVGWRSLDIITNELKA